MLSNAPSLCRHNVPSWTAFRWPQQFQERAVFAHTRPVRPCVQAGKFVHRRRPLYLPELQTAEVKTARSPSTVTARLRSRDTLEEESGELIEMSSNLDAQNVWSGARHITRRSVYKRRSQATCGGRNSFGTNESNVRHQRSAIHRKQQHCDILEDKSSKRITPISN